MDRERRDDQVVVPLGKRTFKSLDPQVCGRKAFPGQGEHWLAQAATLARAARLPTGQDRSGPGGQPGPGMLRRERLAWARATRSPSPVTESSHAAARNSAFRNAQYARGSNQPLSTEQYVFP